MLLLIFIKIRGILWYINLRFLAIMCNSGWVYSFRQCVSASTCLADTAIMLNNKVYMQVVIYVMHAPNTEPETWTNNTLFSCGCGKERRSCVLLLWPPPHNKQRLCSGALEVFLSGLERESTQLWRQGHFQFQKHASFACIWVVSVGQSDKQISTCRPCIQNGS